MIRMGKHEHTHPEERRDKVARTARIAMKKTAIERPDKSLKQIYNHRFQTDFESSAIQATKETFPAAEVKGCNFHFCQAV